MKETNHKRFQVKKKIGLVVMTIIKAGVNKGRSKVKQEEISSRQTQHYGCTIHSSHQPHTP